MSDIVSFYRRVIPASKASFYYFYYFIIIHDQQGANMVYCIEVE